MQGPIFKFYRVRYTEAYYALSPDERKALDQKIVDIGIQDGVKTHVACLSSWNNENWGAFGLEEFADMDAVVRHNTSLMAIDWFRYIECETMLGTPFTPGAG